MIVTLVLLIRTFIIYIILIAAMRIMGKRQIGQLEVTDLVTTIMLSEIATLPIENTDIPLINAIIPIIVLLTFEVISSALQLKFPGLKNLFSSRPGYLIKKGKIIQSEMYKNRISVDELISELRQNGITDISEAEYVIIEPDGKLSVIPNATSRPLCPADVNIKTTEKGLTHIIISNGVLNRFGLSSINKDEAWLRKKLKKFNASQKDIYLMTSTDSGQIFLSRKNNLSKCKERKR